MFQVSSHLEPHLVFVLQVKKIPKGWLEVHLLSVLSMELWLCHLVISKPLTFSKLWCFEQYNGDQLSAHSPFKITEEACDIIGVAYKTEPSMQPGRHNPKVKPRTSKNCGAKSEVCLTCWRRMLGAQEKVLLLLEWVTGKILLVNLQNQKDLIRLKKVMEREHLWGRNDQN